MKTFLQWSIVAAAVMLGGCDAAKEPMAKAREAEASGKIAEAKTLYADVCKAAENSPFCPAAKQRIEALSAREVMVLVADGQYAKAKEESAKIADPAAKRAIDALSKTRTMNLGASFDEALAMADKSAMRTKMEQLAKESSPVAGKAKEWLDKNGPAMLLVEMKAACKPDGTGSCKDLGEAMAKSFSSAPEAAEAKALVDTEYKRLFPLLKQAEALLVQRLEIYNWQTKQDLCLKQMDPSEPEAAAQSCKDSIGIPADRSDPFSTSFLEKAWQKKLDEIHDPGWKKSLEERWNKAGSGIYDPANLPKPGEQKK